MKLIASLILLIACWATNASAQVVGFDQTILYADGDRPLKTSIWYPSETTFPREKIADNPAFLGTDVVRIGMPLAGSFPLVVMSHGYRGSWRNQNWLAMKLVQEGYIVAAVDHPGTTTFDHSPTLAAQWWERPKDLSRLMDWLLADSILASSIDQTNISAIGHSLGGWTVMALAGAQFDRTQFMQECVLKPNPRVCGLMAELGLDKKQAGEPKASLQDQRVKRVISMDLGLARSFSRQSLTAFTIPTLILAAGVDIGDLPYEEESGFLAQYIPNAKAHYKVYPDANHFSFMQLCKPGAIEIIEEETPGDGIVCQDGNQRTREALHYTMFQDILFFLKTPK